MNKKIRKMASFILAAGIIMVLFSGTVVAKEYGDFLAEYGGVPAFSSGDCTATYAGKCADLANHNHWQCVEYVDRFYEIAMGMPEAKNWNGNAGTYYNQAEKGKIKLDYYLNGENTPPQADDLLVFTGGIGGYGHVAIITKVNDKTVEIIEQNWARNDAIHSIDYDPVKNIIGDKNKNGNRGKLYHVQGWLRKKGVRIVDQKVYCGNQICSPKKPIVPGSELTFVYTINNPYKNSTGYILGAQIRKSYLKDEWNDDWEYISGTSVFDNKIINIIPGTHEYSRKFNVPDTVINGNYDVRWIMLHSSGNEKWNGSRVLNNVFKVQIPDTPAPPKPTITVIAPDNGNVWKIGSFQFIKWTYFGNPGPLVKIELLKNGQTIKNIGTSLIVDGFYLWLIPNDLTLGEDYQIKISSVSYPEYSDTSDGYFALGKLNLVTPNGGEIWQVTGNPLLDTHSIKWDFIGSNLGPEVTLEFLDSCLCSPAKLINANALIEDNGQKSYVWTIPSDTKSGQYLVRITSNSHPEFFDMSDSPFIIKAAPVISAITVSPAVAIVQIDETQAFTAIVSDQYDNPIKAAISWSVENATVGSINADGFFIAAANGSTKVIATNGSISGNATVNVMLPPLPPNAKYVIIQNQTWVWVPVIQVSAYGTLYPIYAFPSDGSFLMDTPLGSESYIEKKFYVPLDAINLSTRIWGAKNMDGSTWCGEPVTTTISLIDPSDVFHELDKFTPVQTDNGIGDSIGPRNYSITPYTGQTVKIRIDQTSGYGHCTYGFYKDIGTQTS